MGFNTQNKYVFLFNITQRVGLEWLDLHSFINSLKLTWIRRLIHKEGSWILSNPL